MLTASYSLNITVTTEGKAWCASHGDDSNIGFYNECLDWKRLERKLCTKWRFTEQPEGIEQKDWEFCFQFWGMDKTRNGFDVHEIQDFSFDGATRNLPWHEDYYAPKEVMDDTCSKLCFNKLSHMQRFDSKKGGDFSQITSYHVSPPFLIPPSPPPKSSRHFCSPPPPPHSLPTLTHQKRKEAQTGNPS